MEVVEKTLQWFQDNEALFKEQGKQVKELEEVIKLLTEEVELVKKAFREDIQIAIQTITLLQKQNTELTERAEAAEEKLKNVTNLNNLDMY